MSIISVSGVNNAAILTRLTEDTQKTENSNFSSYLDKAAAAGNADSLEQIFQKAADTYQVSKDLLKAMAKAESSFNAKATSKSGAMGIMQLMPGTAASLGVTDAYDPEQNIMGGAKYISQLLKKYNGNLSYALAAYNAGSGNVDKYGGIPPFSETQNYVTKILKYLQEGVTIPDSAQSQADSAASSAASSAEQTENAENTGVSPAGAAVSAASSLRDFMGKYFDYEDYLEFLQLFTKIISEKVNGQKEELEETEDGQAQPEETQEEEAAEPARQLTMTVRDTYGNVQNYTQEAVPAPGDAYKAYQRMLASGGNHITVKLTPGA